jgi:transcription termination factor Rho
MPSLSALLTRPLDDLRAQARRLGLTVPRSPWREGLVTAIAHHQREGDDPHLGCGVLEVHSEGFGFLRSPYDDFRPGAEDIYVSQSQIRRFRLRTGDTVIGCIRPPKEQERYSALLRVELINGAPPDSDVPAFDAQAAVHPSTRLPLTRDAALLAIDHVAPLGLGARGLVVGATSADRTDVLQRVARAFGAEEGLRLWVLLVAERPEEVTDWRDAFDVEVIATPFDEAPARHLHVATMTLERARRLAERGEEIVVLIDGFNRLLRAAIAESDGGGKIEGVEASALQRVRQLFSAGRDLRDAGSVTVLGTVGGDDALSGPLHHDLADVATWQVTLRAAEAGAVPDPADSWARREDLLLTPDELARRRQWRSRLPTDLDGLTAAFRQLARPAALDNEAAAGK